VVVKPRGGRDGRVGGGSGLPISLHEPQNGEGDRRGSIAWGRAASYVVGQLQKTRKPEAPRHVRHVDSPAGSPASNGRAHQRALFAGRWDLTPGQWRERSNHHRGPQYGAGKERSSLLRRNFAHHRAAEIGGPPCLGSLDPREDLEIIGPAAWHDVPAGGTQFANVCKK